MYNNTTLAAEPCQSYCITVYLWMQTSVTEYIMIYVVLLSLMYKTCDGALRRGVSTGGSGMRWHGERPQAGMHQHQQTSDPMRHSKTCDIRMSALNMLEKLLEQMYIGLRKVSYLMQDCKLSTP